MLDLISFHNWTQTLNQIPKSDTKLMESQQNTVQTFSSYVFSADKKAGFGFVLIDNGAQGLNIILKIIIQKLRMWVLIPILNLDNSVNVLYHIQNGEDI